MQYYNLRDRSSRVTLGSSFFDQFWPLILEDNICDIRSKDHETNFVPERPFNQLHWHTFLANIGFPQYKTPVDIVCCQAEELRKQSDGEAHRAADETAQQRVETTILGAAVSGAVQLKSMPTQIDNLRTQQEHRQKLAFDFANRKYPWTMQQPSYEQEFEITNELRECFKSPFQRQILESIPIYGCKLMIIDAGPETCIDEFQRWIKFRPYVQMLALVRCPRVERHVLLLDGVFRTLMVEENMENNWHDELNCSLRSGLKYAKENNMHKNCADAFIFVFAKQRGYCTVDTFKVLRAI